MRILILSDIHANLEALDACLAAAPDYDTVYNLGDIVGYGANPNETTQRSRELGSVFVRGNHDKVCSGISSLEGFNPIAALAVIWTQEQLTSEHLHFLHGMPRGPLTPFENLEIVHGSPRDEDEYLLYPRDAFSILARTASPLIFFGHTHVQGGYWVDEVDEDQGLIQPQYSGAGNAKIQFDLKHEAKYLINPGSVGQPRDGDPRAAFALYDSEQSSVTFYRVPYDIETAQRKIFDAGLPERLAIRLAEGR